MSWIRDKLLGLRAVFFGGEQLPGRGALEFAGDGVEVEDDPVNKRTLVTIAGGGGGGEGGSSRREYVVQHVAGPVDPEEPWVYYASGPADVELELVVARVSLVTPSGAAFSIGQGPVIQILSRTSGGSETVIAELDLDGVEMTRGQLVAMTATGTTVASGRLVAVKITNDDIEVEVPQLSIIAVFQPVSEE